MSERVSIPHTDIELGGPNIQPSPAWWIGQNNIVFMRCACGGLLTLQGHDIESNGDVNPSIFHPKEWAGCDWHVWGHLEDWHGL